MENLITIINKISEESKNRFKPDLKKYGKNFRAISESAILEILNPLFKKYNISYEVIIKDKSLKVERVKAGRDQSGALIEKLVFVADVEVMLVLTNPAIENSKGEPERMAFQGWGSGVDSGDKATGKAFTAAVKYALFKGFRLQYSDDPDAEESEEITSLIEEESAPAKKEEKKSSKKESAVESVQLASEKQLGYIKGLCVSLSLSDEDFKKEFKYLPYDEKMPMAKAREIIDILNKRIKDGLPF